eukprot:scaffold2243_cov122-Cylindrotheca_fusiformis.AAC.17
MKNRVLSNTAVICLASLCSPCVGFGPLAKLGLPSDNRSSPWSKRRSTLGDAEAANQKIRSQEQPEQSHGGGVIIPSGQIDKLQQSVDLISVVESYNLPQFKRIGDRATCICPFHDDNNPSLRGNVFNFVRGYSKLQGEEMSFFRAVKLVNDKYANGLSLDLPSGPFGTSTKQIESYKIQEAKKQRVMQANLAAAYYFEQNLVSLPAAGVARSYLRARGMTPSTVRAFAIGYAPDCYFHRKSYGPTGWGEGSLVHYLADKNFTAQEIFDAGLATRTRAKTKQGSNADTGEDSEDGGQIPTLLELDISNLMDRFRGRVVIPIFDASGKHVLGFGGRILKEGEEDSAFKPAKYLNSPDSLVFKKQSILYGQHMAKQSLRYWRGQDKDTCRPVVIVEGYMDAIALWQAGIREAVASMGTALTKKQLNAAAAIAGTRNGRIVICLDNDTAGLDAIERLCAGNIFSSATEEFPLEILIASLPKGIKDPAHYIEHIKYSSDSEEKFRTDVVEQAIEWSDWYIKHLISCYDSNCPRGSQGSFGDIFERLAVFLSSYKNAAERTKRACEVAACLADILSNDGNATQVSSTVRLQLETDLVDRVASIANSKAAILDRLASSGDTDGDLRKKLYNVANGDGRSGIDEASKMSKNALKQAPRRREGKAKASVSSKTIPLPPQHNEERSPLQRSRLMMNRHPFQKELDLTPHFSGFEFLSDNDAKWLGVLDEKGKKKNNRLVPKSVVNKFGELNDLKQKKPVYFNSNEYHGNRFLTEEANLAGYKDTTIDRDCRLFEKGVSSILQFSESKAPKTAEDSLLGMLLMFSSARKSLKAGIEVSYASGSNKTIEWSSPARKWLFSCLVDEEADIPQHIVDPSDLEMLRTYLSARPDAPPFAFESNHDEHDDIVEVARSASASDGVVVSGENCELEVLTTKDGESVVDSNDPTVPSTSPTMGAENSLVECTSKPSTLGELDHVFGVSLQLVGDIKISCASSEKFELAAQEAYSTLLLASTRNRLSRIQHQLTAAIGLLQQSEVVTDDESRIFCPEGKKKNTKLPSSLQFFNQTVTREELENICTDLVTSVQDFAQDIKSITASNHRLTKRLTEMVLSSGLGEGEISKTECDQLNMRLKEEMKEIMSGESWSKIDAQSEGDEAYEDALDRAQMEWGELFEDGRMWSPDDVRSAASTKSEVDDPSAMDHVVLDAAADDPESIDDFLSRVDSEWGWIDSIDGDSDDDNVDYSQGENILPPPAARRNLLQFADRLERFRFGCGMDYRKNFLGFKLKGNQLGFLRSRSTIGDGAAAGGCQASDIGRLISCLLFCIQTSVLYSGQTLNRVHWFIETRIYSDAKRDRLCQKSVVELHG